MRRIKGIIRKLVLGLLLKLNQKKNNYPILLDVNRSAVEEQKRILLCYLDYVSSNIRLYKNPTHTNFSELDVVIKVLIDENYVIDVCSFEAEGIDEILAERKYDVIIGFGRVFRKAVELHPHAKKILYVTENPYHISKKEEEARIQYYQERTGYTADLYRTGKCYKEDDLKKAEAIICLGEKRHFAHLNIPVIHVTPTGLHNESYQFRWGKKDKYKFLVWGSNGFLHKGIDILIEVFKLHPDWYIYICGAGTDKALKKFHINDIPDNIRLCGHVNIQSEEFIELVNQCVFVLLPSCSEACATGLLSCMRHGLVPITTKNNGMEKYAEYCYFFEGYHIEEVEDKIKELLMVEMKELEKLAYDIWAFSNKEFTLSRFYADMKLAIEQLM